LLNGEKGDASASGLLPCPLLCDARLHDPAGPWLQLKAFYQYDVPGAALDFGRRFATAVFERAIPENAVPADDFA